MGFKNVWSKVIKGRNVESGEEGRKVEETEEKLGACESKYMFVCGKELLK